MKKIKTHTTSKPWLTKSLINCCRKKNKLYKKYLLHNDKNSENRYKVYKNKLTDILRKAETKYYSEKLSKVKGDIKGTWKILKEIINKRNGNRSTPQSFKYNKTVLTDPQSIANYFNEYITNLGPPLSSKIDSSCGDISNYLKGDFSSSMFLSPTDKEEIYKTIMKQKSNKDTGYDDISINVVKFVADSLSNPLCEIFNNSLKSGIFPNSLKIAKVIPIFKSGDKETVCNYRPVSVLSTFSKLLERIFYNRLYEYVNKRNILNDSQYGFLEKKSISMALIDLVNEILSSLDDNKFTAGVFIDLKKPSTQ